MRHYLTEKEFADFVLRERLGCCYEFTLLCEDNCGEVQTMRFRDDWFVWRIILYTYPNSSDIGVIQEDIDNGWDDAVHDVWVDITVTCEWRPFFEIEDRPNNLF